MKSLFFYEWKRYVKTMLIWLIVVSGMGILCIGLYQSIQEEMEGMAQQFASMGAFSDAMGMSTLSIATIKGYFATEVGTIHALGGSMFAATLGIVILSKEEDAHTAEFLFTLPLKRQKFIGIKWLVLMKHILFFSVVSGVLYQVAFCLTDANDLGKDLALYILLQFVMNLEIASICFLFSSVFLRLIVIPIYWKCIIIIRSCQEKTEVFVQCA